MKRSTKLTIGAGVMCLAAYGAIAGKVKAPKVVVVKVSKTAAKAAASAAPVVVAADPTITTFLPGDFEPIAAPASAAAATLPGVNLSGGDFGPLPGRLWWEYTYPSTADIDYFAARGMKLIRIPFRWERLQPTLYGALSEPDRAALKAAVTYATGKGLTVVLDMHDYGYRRAGAALNYEKIGSAAVTASALTNGWTMIANDYRDNPKVWLGLMNEPFGIAPADWWRSVQQLVTDLRAQRITNKLMIPGVAWSGAHSWISSGNAAEAEKFTDPGGNFAFEVHQYLDADSSGTSAACTPGAAGRVDGVISWAKTRNVQLFMGEMGASGDAQCATEYPAMLKRLNTSGVVIAWAAWGGGSWWANNYHFKLSPITGQESTAHMLLLQANLPEAVATAAPAQASAPAPVPVSFAAPAPAVVAAPVQVSQVVTVQTTTRTARNRQD